MRGWMSMGEKYSPAMPGSGVDALMGTGGIAEGLLAACAARVPGDTQRNLRVSAEWSGQTFKHVLMPVWLLTYDYGRKSYQCVMNGVTGRIEGEYPKSPWKIAFAVLVLFVVVVVRGWNRSREWRRYADESAARGIVARLRWHGFDAAMERAT